MAMHVTDMLDSVISQCYGRFAVPGSVRRNGLEPSNRILAFASPRGGSTWLSEVLGLMESAVVVSEPFKKGKVREIDALGFTWHQPIPSDARWPEALDSVGAILNLRSVPRELYPFKTAMALRGKRQFIFKLCYAHLMISWLLEHFPSKAIFMTRHPCAVVASQMQHPSWSGIPDKESYNLPQCRHSEVYAEYSDVLDEVHSRAGYLAWIWSVTTHVAWRYAQENPAVLKISYEQMITDFDQEVGRIYEFLGLPVPSAISHLGKNPSVTASLSLGENLRKGTQLTSWRTTLNLRQQQEILEVARACGISFYSNDVEPDPDQFQ